MGNTIDRRVKFCIAVKIGDSKVPQNASERIHTCNIVCRTSKANGRVGCHAMQMKILESNLDHPTLGEIR